MLRGIWAPLLTVTEPRPIPKRTNERVTLRDFKAFLFLSSGVRVEGWEEFKVQSTSKRNLLGCVNTAA